MGTSRNYVIFFDSSEKSLGKLNPQTYPLFITTAIAVITLFTCSSIRHYLLKSTGWDLGIFDQAIYLISIGKAPFSTFLDFHILGDHAAFIFYPLALLYKIYPDVHWLFAVQSLVLATGNIPTWLLSRQAGLSEKQSLTMAIVYLLYPLVFNINLFDFHPDVFVLPGILWAVFAARSNSIWWFCGAITLILSCKGVLALTVSGLGFWLLVFEKKKLAGLIALVAGIIWFLIAVKGIIPNFGTDAADVSRHLSRYPNLGKNFTEITRNLITNPNLLLVSIFNTHNFFYLLLILAPLGWGISLGHLAPLTGAIPALAMNLLTTSQVQKDLIHQYSLPILPFLILSVISTFAAGKTWIKKDKLIMLWSIVSFMILAKYGYFSSIYLANFDTLMKARSAIAIVPPQGSILTNSEISPHLSHREVIRISDDEDVNFTLYDHILLNVNYSGWLASPEIPGKIVQKVSQNPDYKLIYSQNRVFLFSKEFVEK